MLDDDEDDSAAATASVAVTETPFADLKYKSRFASTFAAIYERPCECLLPLHTKTVCFAVRCARSDINKFIESNETQMWLAPFFRARRRFLCTDENHKEIESRNALDNCFTISFCRQNKKKNAQSPGNWQLK